MLEHNYFRLFLLFIISFGVTTLVKGIGEYLKNRDIHSGKIKFSWTMFFYFLAAFMGLFQLFLAQYNGNGEGIKYPFIMFTTLCSSILMVLICYMLTPNLNAPDVFEKLKKGEDYLLSNYFNRQRHSISIVGIVIIPFLVMNFFYQWDASISDYVSERLYIHVTQLFIFLTIYFLDFKYKYFWAIQTSIAFIMTSLLLITTVQVFLKVT